MFSNITTQNNKMRIGLTYNLKENAGSTGIVDTESCEEFDTLDTVNAICDVFNKNGFQPVKLGGDISIVDRLREQSVDFVFNIAEGFHGRNREGHIPALLEMLGIPYSGSDSLTLGVTLDKIMAKKMTAQIKIPTPRYKMVKNSEEVSWIENQLLYPLITKPAWEGSSKGIYNSSRVYGYKGLKASVETLFRKYPDQPVLVEEYIKGREVTVGVIGNEAPRILGIMEIVNRKTPGEDFFYSLEVKKDWINLVDYVSPADISFTLEKHIRQYAIKVFKEFGCRDIARIDFRISEYGQLFLLDINPLPGLSPEYGDIVIMARKHGVEYDNLVLSILTEALERHGLLSKKSGMETGVIV